MYSYIVLTRKKFVYVYKQYLGFKEEKVIVLDMRFLWYRKRSTSVNWWSESYVFHELLHFRV